MSLCPWSSKLITKLVISFLLQILLFKLQVSLCPWSSEPSFVNKICARSPLLCEIALQTKKRQLKRCFCGCCDICLHPGRKVVTNAKEHSHTYNHLLFLQLLNYVSVWRVTLTFWTLLVLGLSLSILFVSDLCVPCFSFEINSYFLGCCSPLVFGVVLVISVFFQFCVAPVSVLRVTLTFGENGTRLTPRLHKTWPLSARHRMSLTPNLHQQSASSRLSL